MHNPLDITDVTPTPVLIAALGPLMLRLAGERTDGTILWMADERAIESHIAPQINRAAEAAGRPAPRIVAGVPVCVCDEDEVDIAVTRTNRILAEAEMSPNYQQLLDRGDAREVGDILAAGSEATVRSDSRRSPTPAPPTSASASSRSATPATSSSPRVSAPATSSRHCRARCERARADHPGLRPNNPGPRRREELTMPPTRVLDIPVFDADNHLYETRDSLTKFLPDRYKGAVDYVDVRGRTKIVVRGTISEYIPNPTFEVVARPGAQEDYFRKGNPEGQSRREIFGEPMRVDPGVPRAAPHGSS